MTLFLKPCLSCLQSFWNFLVNNNRPILTLSCYLFVVPALQWFWSVPYRINPAETCKPAMEGSGEQSFGLPTLSVQVQQHEGATKAPNYDMAARNGSANYTYPFADVALLQVFKPLIIPCYTLVLLVGVFGNYLLLYVICRTRKMHNVTNFFIGNLAFSDMLMCVTCVPFTLAYAFNPRGWVFGRYMCYLVFLIQPVTVYVSVFTLTAIAVDR